MNYAGFTEVFAWLIVFTLLSRTASAILKVSTICFCPLLLASSFFIYIVQFSRCRPSGLFQDQIETLNRSNASIHSRISTEVFFASFLFKRKEVVGLDGLEPSTSRLSVVRSSQLSYGPVRFAALQRAPSKLNNVSRHPAPNV